MNVCSLAVHSYKGKPPLLFRSLGDPMFQMLEVLLVMFIDLPPRMKPGVSEPAFG